MATKKQADAKRKVPEYKLKIVDDLVKKIKDSKTLLVASTKGLPSSQFHAIKKIFRGKADIKVVKKSAALRAIDRAGISPLLDLKTQVVADVALFFSNLDTFELSGLLTDNQSPTKARAGDIAPEDIVIEPGLTDLVPGPAISELSGVGLKVAVENGKLAIKTGAKVAKKGEAIKPNVAAVLGKLNILPMKVGFEPIAAFSSQDNKVYVGIKIDKTAALEELRASIGRALNLAINIGYPNSKTIGYFISKASMQEKALAKLISDKNTQQNDQEVK